MPRFAVYAVQIIAGALLIGVAALFAWHSQWQRLKQEINARCGLVYHGKFCVAEECRPTPRGCVDVDICDETFGDDDVARMRIGPHIAGIRLDSSQITDRALDTIAAFSWLDSLSVFDTAITDQGLIALSRARGLERLSVTNTRITEQGVKALRGLPKLRVLNVFGTKLRRLELVEGFASLERIDCGANDLTEVLVQNCPKLAELEIESSELSTVSVNDCRSLRRLEIASNGSPIVVRLGHLPALREISIYGKLGTQSAIDVSDANELRELRIDGPGIDSAVVTRFLQASGLVSVLLNIELHNDPGPVFTAVSKLKHLETLSIDCPVIGLDGLKRLLEVKSLRNLTIGWATDLPADWCTLVGRSAALEELSLVHTNAFDDRLEGLEALSPLRLLRVRGLSAETADRLREGVRTRVPRLELVVEP